jgi:hypothetical protein
MRSKFAKSPEFLGRKTRKEERRKPVTFHGAPPRCRRRHRNRDRLPYFPRHPESRRCNADLTRYSCDAVATYPELVLAASTRRRPCSYGPCPFRLSALPSDRLEPGLNIRRGRLVKTEIVRLQTPPCNRTVEEAGIKETPPSSIVRFSFVLIPDLQIFAAALAKKKRK